MRLSQVTITAALCLYLCSVVGVVFCRSENAVDEFIAQDTMSSFLDNTDGAVTSPSPPLMVPITLIQGADKKGAVCLDGSLPAYYLHRGFGSGANSWVIQLEGGGWCNNVRSCVFRQTTRHGSSKFMEKQLAFTGILSNKAEENPPFFNWNRVKLRYCDGASFIGDSQDEARKLYYRGQRIWQAAMEYLLTIGMEKADQALLSGCSAGGLASILHCDEFRVFFPKNIKVKCLSDAGMFLDALDVSGGKTLRTFYDGVVTTQNLQNNLPKTCSSGSDPAKCFFPQNLIDGIKTPMFLLNSAYDVWQVQNSLAPKSADPSGTWQKCKSNHTLCNSTQIDFLQAFRNQMVSSVKSFSTSNQNALFINSCFAHCQSELQNTWFAPNSPRLGNKRIAEAVGDWFNDRMPVKSIDCPYPCGNNCQNLEHNIDTSWSVMIISPSTRLALTFPNLILVCLVSSNLVHIQNQF